MKELVTGGNKMSVINIYVNDENKVNVKDDTQIIKIKGDKGDQMRYEDLTPEQKAELKGPKGDALRFEDLTEEQKAELKGPKGDALRFEDLTEEQKAELKGPKGDALRFEDLTEEQKEELKGPKGDKGETPSVPNTVHFLKENFINVPDDDLDSALLALFEANKDSLFANYDNLSYQYPFECEEFNQGDTNLVVHGINHFKVRVNNGEEVEIIDNVANIPVEATNNDYLNVEYIDIVGNVRELKSVEVIKEDSSPAEEYDLGAGTFILKGKSATIKTKATGNKFTFPSELTTKLSDITLRKLTIDFAIKNPNRIEATFKFIPKMLNFVNCLDTDKFYFEIGKSVNFNTKINFNGTLKYDRNISGVGVYSENNAGVLIGSPV